MEERKANILDMIVKVDWMTERQKKKKKKVLVLGKKQVLYYKKKFEKIREIEEYLNG